MAVTAVHILNNHVPPFFDDHGVRVETALNDNGREFCGRQDRHPYELFLQFEEIEHHTTQVGRPQSNGFIQRFRGTLLNENLRIMGRTTWYKSVTEMKKNSTPRRDLQPEPYAPWPQHGAKDAGAKDAREKYQGFKKGIQKPRSRKDSTRKEVKTAA